MKENFFEVSKISRGDGKIWEWGQAFGRYSGGNEVPQKERSSKKI